ncbi:hypothetical protein [Pelagibacterium sp.]|uniref:hypothetical protein n=1 Tax=Pelagibacterium sp. TaxID=1967288 RepID=UPI003A951821
MEKWSALELDGIAITDAAARGIRETLIWDHAAQFERDVNGVFMTGSAMQSPWGRKARYRWEARGAGVLDLPALDHLEPLSILTITPIDPWRETIAAGATSHVLKRTPLAGSVRLFHPVTGDAITHNRNGKTITLAGQPRTVQVEYRPPLTVTLIQADKSVEEDEQRYSWTVEVAEV